MDGGYTDGGWYQGGDITEDDVSGSFDITGSYEDGGYDGEGEFVGAGDDKCASTLFYQVGQIALLILALLVIAWFFGWMQVDGNGISVSSCNCTESACGRPESALVYDGEGMLISTGNRENMLEYAGKEGMLEYAGKEGMLEYAGKEGMLISTGNNNY